MGHLLARHLKNRLIQGLASLAWQASGKDLEKALTIYDPGGGPALIGRDRAGDMGVNVVLPFLHAWSFPRGDSALGARALSLYQGYRKLQANRLTREMEESLFPRTWLPLARGACHQQGLIHLHHLAAGEG